MSSPWMYSHTESLEVWEFRYRRSERVYIHLVYYDIRKVRVEHVRRGVTTEGVTGYYNRRLDTEYDTEAHLMGGVDFSYRVLVFIPLLPNDARVAAWVAN